MKTLKSKKPANQKKVNRAIKWLLAHNNLNNLRDIYEGEGNEKEYNKVNRKCENTFDKFLEAMEELPKYEQKNIYNSNLY